MSIYYKGKDIEKLSKEELLDTIKEMCSSLIAYHQTINAIFELVPPKIEVKRR